LWLQVVDEDEDERAAAGQGHGDRTAAAAAATVPGALQPVAAAHAALHAAQMRLWGDSVLARVHADVATEGSQREPTSHHLNLYHIMANVVKENLHTIVAGNHR
jgi:hypothetical protein